MTEINYLTISVDKLKNMEPETLRKYAEEKSATILLDIESAIKAIDEFSSHTSSQSELKGIENVKNFFSFGNTKRNKDLEALKQDFAQSHDDISKIMYDEFKRLGIPVYMTREEDMTLSPKDRVAKAMNFLAKIRMLY